jgi:hypothetical protein
VRVNHDAAQPAGEPVWVMQPIQPYERLQKGRLNHVIDIPGIKTQPDCPGPRHGLVPLDEQAERVQVARPSEPD